MKQIYKMEGKVADKLETHTTKKPVYSPHIAAEIFKEKFGVHPETITDEANAVLKVIGQCQKCFTAIFDNEEKTEKDGKMYHTSHLTRPKIGLAKE